MIIDANVIKHYGVPGMEWGQQKSNEEKAKDARERRKKKKSEGDDVDWDDPAVKKFMKMMSNATPEEKAYVKSVAAAAKAGKPPPADPKVKDFLSKMSKASPAQRKYVQAVADAITKGKPIKPKTQEEFAIFKNELKNRAEVTKTEKTGRVTMTMKDGKTLSIDPPDEKKK